MDFLHSILLLHHLLFAGTMLEEANHPPISGIAVPFTSAEHAYYQLVFDYTMNYTVGGSSYDWEMHAGNGIISVSNAYISKSGALCRNFSESFSVRGQSGSGEGVACKRKGAEGWCKLRTDQAATCAMEPAPNALATMMNMLR
jgi:hypothetical protein